jgi:uncharacterized protein YyaL (SSP411 family)
LPPLLAARSPVAGRDATAYLCKGLHCYPPTHDPEALKLNLTIG